MSGRSTTIPRKERRRHPRALTDLRAMVTVGGASHPARVINLSMGGALLNVAEAPASLAAEVGQAVSLQIRCRGHEGVLRADARVVNSHRAPDEAPLLAVQFEPIRDEDSDLLEELMYEALSQIYRRDFG